MPYEYREPDVIETRETTIVDREPERSSGAAIALVLGVLVVLGLIGFFALNSGQDRTTEVRVEQPAESSRAMDIDVDTPDVNIQAPPIINNPPVIDNSADTTTDSSTSTDQGSDTTGTTDETSTESGQ